jgi:hypothetical protein
MPKHATLPVNAGTNKYLCEDGSWKTVSGGPGGAVDSVFGRSGTVSAAEGDYSAFFSPIAHGHDGVYSPVAHNHDGAYSALGHTHAYQPVDSVLTNTTASFTTAQETKLAGIAAGAEVNVQADWNAVSGDAQILNKPAVVAYTAVATLASNQATGANTTPVSLTGLVWTYAANSVYFFRWIGSVTPAAATTGCGFQLDVSTAVTQIAMQFEHQLASTGTITGGHSIADDASVGVSSGLPGTGVYPVTGSGMLRTGANTGTAQLRFRSETTAVITANAGMTLVVEKVA